MTTGPIGDTYMTYLYDIHSFPDNWAVVMAWNIQCGPEGCEWSVHFISFCLLGNDASSASLALEADWPGWLYRLYQRVE